MSSYNPAANTAAGLFRIVSLPCALPVLYSLAPDKRIRYSDLRRIFLASTKGHSTAGFTRMLHRLEAAGLIARQTRGEQSWVDYWLTDLGHEVVGYARTLETREAGPK